MGVLIGLSNLSAKSFVFIVNNYPENGTTKRVAHNYKSVIKELHYRFASLAAQANPSPIISGDLITADNESPLVNTLYHDMQRSHLNSTHIRIQHAFNEDNCNWLPLAVARKLTKETRQILHSCCITELGN